MVIASTDILISNIVIRPIERPDLISLEWDGELIHYRRLFSQTYQQAELGNAVLLMADYPSIGLLGQLFIQLNSHDPSLADGREKAYIHGFRVRELYRNLGVGSLLLNKAENVLIERGFLRVVLNVGRENIKAIQLYERNGYKISFAIPGSWSYIDHLGHRCDVNEPGWRMEKKLG